MLFFGELNIVCNISYVSPSRLQMGRDSFENNGHFGAKQINMISEKNNNNL